jgi:hypothetical protein
MWRRERERERERERRLNVEGALNFSMHFLPRHPVEGPAAARLLGHYWLDNSPLSPLAINSSPTTICRVLSALVHFLGVSPHWCAMHSARGWSTAPRQTLIYVSTGSSTISTTSTPRSFEELQHRVWFPRLLHWICQCRCSRAAVTRRSSASSKRLGLSLSSGQPTRVVS